MGFVWVHFESFLHSVFSPFHSVVNNSMVSLCRGLRTADVRAGHRRVIGNASGRGRHTKRHGDCGACACVSAC